MKFLSQFDHRYLVTRPRLRSFLELEGFHGEEVKNPYSEYLQAWIFPLTRDLAAAVHDWYAENHLEVPYRITEYLRTVEW